MKDPVEIPKVVTKISTTINSINQHHQLEEPKFQYCNSKNDEVFDKNIKNEDELLRSIDINDFQLFPDSSDQYDDNLQNNKIFENFEYQNIKTQEFNDQFTKKVEGKEEKDKNIEIPYCEFSKNNSQKCETKKINNQVETSKGKKEKDLKIEKNRKRKRYKSKNNIGGINNQKMFNIYKEEIKIKIGNNTNKKSKRESNQLNMIKRNLIQDNFRNWINYGEKDKNNNICKLDPNVLGYTFEQKTLLKDIYSQAITIKEIDKNHNINIINKAEGNKKMKLNLSYKDALKLFFEHFKENELFQKIQQLKENNGVNDNINSKEFLNGLQKSEDYLKEKGVKPAYSNKLKNTLDKFQKIYLK